jgi:hypothetical protein
MTINILELDQVCDITQEVYFSIVDHFGIAKNVLSMTQTMKMALAILNMGKSFIILLNILLKTLLIIMKTILALNLNLYRRAYNVCYRL